MKTTPARVSGLRMDGVSIRIPLPGRPLRWVHAAEQLDLRIEPGQITAVVGESGCGKSVLALAALGLLPAGTRTSGRILVADTDLLSATDATLQTIRGARIGLIPQSAATHLTPVRTVGAQLIEHLRRHGRAATPTDVAGLLRGVGLPAGSEHRYPHELSGGMAQRVLVALTLSSSPEVLIADEPTSALDPQTARGVLGALRGQADRGGCVLLVTHDLLLARDFADRVAVMYAGRFLEVGPTEVVLRQPAHDYTRTLLNSLPENGLQPPPGLPSSLVDPLAGVCAWHRRAGRPCSAGGLQPLTPLHRVACRDVA